MSKPYPKGDLGIISCKDCPSLMLCPYISAEFCPRLGRAKDTPPRDL